MKQGHFLGAFIAIGEMLAEQTRFKEMMKPQVDNARARAANNAAFSCRSRNVRSLYKPASNRRGR
jgi:hypothetical protein